MAEREIAETVVKVEVTPCEPGKNDVTRHWTHMIKVTYPDGTQEAIRYIGPGDSYRLSVPVKVVAHD